MRPSHIALVAALAGIAVSSCGSSGTGTGTGKGTGQGTGTTTTPASTAPFSEWQVAPPSGTNEPPGASPDQDTPGNAGPGNESPGGGGTSGACVGCSGAYICKLAALGVSETYDVTLEMANGVCTVVNTDDGGALGTLTLSGCAATTSNGFTLTESNGTLSGCQDISGTNLCVTCTGFPSTP